MILVLQLHHLSKHYGAVPVISDASFIVNDGEHVGLIGPNGSGKSTLLRCIVGIEQPDGGVITLAPPDMTIGYLPQALDKLLHMTVGEAIAEAQRELVEAEHGLQQAAQTLAEGMDEARMEAYTAALARYEALGGYEREHRAATVLQGLQLGDVDPATPVTTLSGGQKTRLGLATLLLREPDLLLLDEPTNHLDVDALEWLERFILASPKAIVIVSHDRAFLDRTVTRILYLNPDSRTVRSYPGNYSDFAAARDHEHQIHLETWKQQQEYIERVETDIAQMKAHALSVELTTTPSQPTVRRYAKKVARKAKSRERKLERYMESDERVEKPKLSWQIKLDFGAPPPSSRSILHMEHVSFAYPENPPLFTDVNLDVQYGEKIALVGPNGAGKTTLLRLIAGEVAPTTGTIKTGPSVRLGMLSQEQETLDPAKTLLETVLDAHPMSETEARSFLHFFLFAGDSVFRRIAACSLGERSRLQLALLVLSGCNLLLLDEPLNHLDIEGREHFEAALQAFEGTVIVVAHDRAFLRSYPTRFLDVRSNCVYNVEGDYEEYNRFLADSEALK